MACVAVVMCVLCIVWSLIGLLVLDNIQWGFVNKQSVGVVVVRGPCEGGRVGVDEGGVDGMFQHSGGRVEYVRKCEWYRREEVGILTIRLPF